MAKLNSFRELRVYQELLKLHIEVNEISMDFPKYELFELGSQLRRSSNAAPAILAEGWGSMHTNIYIESISRSTGELRETQHHLDVAHLKKYIPDEKHAEWNGRYESCGKMLEKLLQSLREWRNSQRIGHSIHENISEYNSIQNTAWNEIVGITFKILSLL